MTNPFWDGDPKTWNSEPLTSADLNTELRDRMKALKDLPRANFDADESSDYTSTSTSFVPVDDTEGYFKHTLTTLGGDVLVHLHATVNNGEVFSYFDLAVDGNRIGGADGIVRTWSGTSFMVSFTRLIRGLDAGSHTFELQWKGSNANLRRLYAGAGTTNADVQPQFWVMEVS